MKKMLSLVLALVLLLGTLPMAAQAEVLSHTHEDTNNDNVCDVSPCTFVMDSCKNGHSPAGNYMSDATQHWQVCSVCKGWVGYTPHSGGEATCSAKAKCAACATEYGDVNVNNHKNTTVKDASAATCATAGHEGNTWCLDCNTVIASGNVIPANTNHIPADSTYGKDATQHWQVCVNGGHYYGYAAHTFTAASCSAAKTCSVCGYVDGTPSAHTWINATCSAPKKCGVCGVTEGTSTGHSWVDATCTAAKFCSVCGEKDGSELGHSWDNNVCTR